MPDLRNLSTVDLRSYREQAQTRYEAFKAQRLNLNLGRGKPSPEQLDLSNGLLTVLGSADVHAADGTDCRNYGGLQGLPEARALFAPIVSASPDRIIVAGNSSLELMHDTVEWAALRGVPGGTAPWSTTNPPAFLCPVPGYDRHFTICDGFGVKMIPVPLTGHGPAMDVVEKLVASDAAIKGIWCVPKYSNPTGEVYSAEVAERLARMPAAAPDFRIFWDNAYAVHHLTARHHEVADILSLCEKYGHPDRAFVFASTSKMTFAGAGVAVFASSPANVKWQLQQMERRTIGADKLNQLRHVRFLKNGAGIRALMEGHARSLVPKFSEVQDTFERLLGGTGVASWTKPEGGYFISLDVLDGCARRVITLAKEAGITVVPAGSTFPYGKDPNDRNIRVAPTFPSLEEVAKAAEGLALATLLAASDAILTTRGETMATSAR
jgi:DNA-binding transcriptional MocR family regulator